MSHGNGRVRCAAYCRTSTSERLGQDFNSIDAQRASIEAFITSRVGEGWELIRDEYADGGFSGCDLQRPALQRLIADIEAKRVDCVLTYKVDRLSRSLADFGRLMELFEAHGTSYVSVTQQIDTSTSMGRLLLNVLQSFSQFEREMVSERTRDKIAATRRRGKWTGGRPLLGYDVDRSGGSPKLVINADEAPRVRQIFELYLEHGSLIPVVKILNDRGWCTKRWVTKAGREMGGRPFDKVRLHQLLTNVVCAGKVAYKDEVHEGEHEAIVSEDLWRKVQARLQRNGRTGGSEARNKHGALLRGLLFCAPCACAMTHSYTRKGAKLYRYYVCSTAQKRGWKSCPSKSVPAAEIEKFVVDQIRCIGRDPTLVAETLDEARRQAEEGLARLDQERGTVERELERDEAALRTTGDPATLADLHERIETARRRLRAITEEVAHLRDGIVGEDELRAALANFDDLWAALAPREQARVLGLLVERVDYDGAVGTVSVTFRPTGIRALEGDQQEAAA